jgi:hypothetical protein
VLNADLGFVTQAREEFACAGLVPAFGGAIQVETVGGECEWKNSRYTVFT